MSADCQEHFACACMIRERAKLEAEVKRLRDEREWDGAVIAAFLESQANLVAERDALRVEVTEAVKLLKDCGPSWCLGGVSKFLMRHGTEPRS